MTRCRQCQERGLDCSFDEPRRELNTASMQASRRAASDRIAVSSNATPTEEDMSTIVDESVATLAAQFKSSVEEQVMGRGRGKRFPIHLQAQAVAYYRKRQEAGAFLSNVAFELGLPPPTLRRWVLDAPDNNSPEIHPARVEASAPTNDTDTTSWKLITKPSPTVPASPAHPVLIGPNGLRIEGLDMMSLAVLLKHIQA